MSSLISSHLMNGIMDCIKIKCLCSLSKVKLTGCSTVLSLYTHLQILLRAVCYNLTKQLCELCSVLCLFVSSLLPIKTDLRITLAMSNTSHCQIHTNL